MYEALCEYFIGLAEPNLEKKVILCEHFNTCLDFMQHFMNENTCSPGEKML